MRGAHPLSPNNPNNPYNPGSSCNFITVMLKLCPGWAGTGAPITISNSIAPPPAGKTKRLQNRCCGVFFALLSPTVERWPRSRGAPRASLCVCVLSIRLKGADGELQALRGRSDRVLTLINPNNPNKVRPRVNPNNPNKVRPRVNPN